jgi:hypothetical protein
MKIPQVGGFLLGAILVAWCAAFADAFVLRMDDVSSRALGSPEYAYGPILISRLLVALVGALVFGAATFLLGNSSASHRRAFGRGASWGAAYSAALAALLHVSLWLDVGAGVLGLWGAAIVLPAAAAWMCAPGGAAQQ